MRSFFDRFDKSYFLLVPVVLHSTWPWFGYRIRTIVPFIIFLIWLCVFKRVNVMFPGKHKLGICFVWVIAWFCFYSYAQNLFALVEYSRFVHWFEYATTLTAISHFVIIYLSFKNLKLREVQFLTIVALIGIILAGVGAVRGSMIEDFEGGRILTTSLERHFSEDNLDNVNLARTIGSAGYGLTYSYAIFMPISLFALFQIKRFIPKLLMACVFISLFLIVKNSGLGTPVFVSVLGFFMFCGLLCGLRQRGILIIGSFAIFCLISFSYNPKIFSFAAPVPQMIGKLFETDSSIQQRCESISSALKGDRFTYAAERYQRQVQSIEVFLEHPLFGVGVYTAPHPKSYLVGGHSCLLDRLGQQGIFGGIFYFGFITSLYAFLKYLVFCFGFNSRWNSNIILVMLCYVFACIANPSPTFPAILYYIPGVFLLVSKYGKGMALRDENSLVI